MAKESIRKKTFINMLWRFVERCGAQGVSFIVSVILARLLVPKDYGTIALIMVFINVLQVFVDSGIASALIQKKEADEIDFSTAFFFNIVSCSVMYLIMFFSAPLIANYYGEVRLVSLIRVVSLTLVISGVKNVQQAYVSRNLLFKKFFFSSLGGTIGAAIIGILMAYNGMGVWALVFQQLFNTTVDTIILWITVKWRPRFLFSIKRLKELLNFGWKMLVSALMETVYSNVQQLIIGKKYSPTDLAFYNRGTTFPNIIITNITTSIDSVLFPVMSQKQDDRNDLKNMTRKSIMTSVYIMAPLMVGFMAAAKPIVIILLTEKWLESIPYMRIFCITTIFYPIHTANLNAIKAMGRSDVFLKLEIVKKIVGIATIIITMNISVMAMAYGLLFTSVACQIINSWPNKKLLKYNYLEQLKDILPTLISASLMGIIIYMFTYLKLNSVIILLMQMIVGLVLYIVISVIIRNETFYYLASIIKNIFLTKKIKK